MYSFDQVRRNWTQEAQVYHCFPCTLCLLFHLKLLTGRFLRSVISMLTQWDSGCLGLRARYENALQAFAHHANTLSLIFWEGVSLPIHDHP